MADFPAVLTNVTPGVTEIKAKHINNLEAKVGIDGSEVVTSLDYLLKNPVSIDPGHKHTLINSASDVTATAAEVNLLDLTGLTAGLVLRATGAATAAWGAIQAGDLPASIDAAKIADGSVSNAEFQCLNGVTSALQTQLDTKAPFASPVFTGNVGIGASSFGTSADKVLALLNGTAPSTSPADTVQLWAADRGATAGKAGLHIRAEDGTSHVFSDRVGIGTLSPESPFHSSFTVDTNLVTSSDFDEPTAIGRKTTLNTSGSSTINSSNLYGAGDYSELRINNTDDWSKLWLANCSRYSYKGNTGKFGVIMDTSSVVEVDTTATVSSIYGIYNSVKLLNSGAVTAMAGTYSRAMVSPITAVTATASAIYGGYAMATGQAAVAGSGIAMTTAYGFAGTISLTATASGATSALTTAYGIQTTITCSASGGGTATITNAYGFYYKEGSSTGTITNLYGVYIEEPTHGSALNYALYSAGGKNYFGGNILLGGTSVLGASAAKVLGIASGAAPSSAPADCAQLWVEDINAAAGKASFHMMAESGTGKLIVAGVLMKSDTGDPSQVHEGLLCINTNDNNVKIYADGGWRQLAAW